jgi:hypothetical protein
VLAGPSRDEALRAFREECGREYIPVLVGSSLQYGYVDRDWAVVELGFPSAEKHAVYPVPWMGFNGAVALVQRLLDASKRVF